MSVGHLARYLEQNGISTVIIATSVFEATLKKMSPPRLLLTRHPMGRPIGPPGDIKKQQVVVESALRLLESSKKPVIVHEKTGAYWLKEQDAVEE